MPRRLRGGLLAVLGRLLRPSRSLPTAERHGPRTRSRRPVADAPDWRRAHFVLGPGGRDARRPL